MSSAVHRSSAALSMPWQSGESDAALLNFLLHGSELQGTPDPAAEVESTPGSGQQPDGDDLPDAAELPDMALLGASDPVDSNWLAYLGLAEQHHQAGTAALQELPELAGQQSSAGQQSLQPHSQGGPDTKLRTKNRCRRTPAQRLRSCARAPGGVSEPRIVQAGLAQVPAEAEGRDQGEPGRRAAPDR